MEDAKTTEKPSIGGGGGGETPGVTAKDIEKKLEESENRRKSLEVSQEHIFLKQNIFTKLSGRHLGEAGRDGEEGRGGEG